MKSVTVQPPLLFWGVWGCSSFAHPMKSVVVCALWAHPCSWGGLKLLLHRKWKIMAGMMEQKNDDHAYNLDRFSRHDALKSESSCLRFTPDNGHFRRHVDVLKRLPCLAVSFWSFLMMMTGHSWKNAASSGHNSSLMPTTRFNSVWFLLASDSFSADLMQHHDL